jgi:hypothetical protein
MNYLKNFKQCAKLYNHNCSNPRPSLKNRIQFMKRNQRKDLFPLPPLLPHPPREEERKEQRTKRQNQKRRKIAKVYLNESTDRLTIDRAGLGGEIQREKGQRKSLIIQVKMSYRGCVEVKSERGREGGSLLGQLIDLWELLLKL